MGCFNKYMTPERPESKTFSISPSCHILFVVILNLVLNHGQHRSQDLVKDRFDTIDPFQFSI